VTGQEHLVGDIATAIEGFDQKGLVRVQSEIWQAESQTKIKKGQRCKVLGIAGLVLKIEKI